MMSDMSQSGKTQVEIPYGLMEYTATFKKPIIEAWSPPGPMVAAILEALEPWGFKLDGVEATTPTKLSDYAISFKRLRPSVTLTVGVGKVVVLAENLDWKEAEDFIATMSAGLNALMQTAKPQIQSQRLGLAMHVQLKARTPQEITAPLINPMALELLEGTVKFQGLILQGESSSIIIDASLAYNNALFVRIFRDHSPETTLHSVADALLNDEKRLFGVLGLEGEL